MVVINTYVFFCVEAVEIYIHMYKYHEQLYGESDCTKSRILLMQLLLELVVHDTRNEYRYGLSSFLIPQKAVLQAQTDSESNSKIRILKLLLLMYQSNKKMSTQLCLIFLTLALFFSPTSAQVLITSEFTSDTFEITTANPNGWEFSPYTIGVTPLPNNLYTDCGSQKGHRIFGGYSIFTGCCATKNSPSYYVAKTFTNLPPHYQLRINVKLFKIDSWNDELIYIQLDGTNYQMYEWDCCWAYVDICGTSDPPDDHNLAMNDGIVTYDKSINHYLPTLKVNISSNINDGENQSWGMREFFLYASLCHPSCLKCKGPGDSDCLQCFANSYLSGGMCKCLPGQYINLHKGCIYSTCSVCETVCPDGTWLKKPTESCQVCSASLHCSTCLNDVSCITCESGYLIDRNNQCVPCSTGCKTCLGYAFVCLLCADGFYFSNYSCLPCPPSCKTCSSYFTCSECNSGYYLAVDMCVPCDPAMTYCEECSLSPSLCSKCQFLYFMQPTPSNQCLPTCPTGYFKDNVARVCTSACPDGFYGAVDTCFACHPSCSKCKASLPSQCYGCVDGYFLLDTTCVTSCPASPPSLITYHQDQITNACYELFDSIVPPPPSTTPPCKITCKMGTYYYLATKSCLTCPINCMYCDPGNSARCFICISPYGLEPITDNCIDCSNIGLYLSSITGQCIASTVISPNQYFDTTNSVFVPCHPTCSSCTNTDPCCTFPPNTILDATTMTCVSSCPTNTYLYEATSTCYATCPGSTIPDPSNGTCVTVCAPGEVVDYINKICVNCPVGSSILNSTCYSQCPYNYYPSNINTCIQCTGPTDHEVCNISIDFLLNKTSTCFYSCDTCRSTGYFECITCKANRGLANGTAQGGMCHCRQGEDEDSKGKCLMKSHSGTQTRITIIVLISFALVTCIFTTWSNGKRFLLYSLIDELQELSLFALIHLHFPQQLNLLFEIFYTFNLTGVLKIFQSIDRSIFSFSQVEIMHVSDYNLDGKYRLLHKSAFFLANTFTTFIFLIAMVIALGLFKYLKNRFPENEFYKKVHKVTWLGLLIRSVWFMLIDTNVNIGTSLRFLTYHNGLAIFSIIFTVLFVFAQIGFVYFMFMKLIESYRSEGFQRNGAPGLQNKFNSLWFCINRDGNILARYFWIIKYSKKLIFPLTYSLGYTNPKAVTILIFFFQVTYTVLCFMASPYNRKYLRLNLYSLQISKTILYLILIVYVWSYTSVKPVLDIANLIYASIFAHLFIEMGFIFGNLLIEWKVYIFRAKQKLNLDMPVAFVGVNIDGTNRVYNNQTSSNRVIRNS